MYEIPASLLGEGARAVVELQSALANATDESSVGPDLGRGALGLAAVLAIAVALCMLRSLLGAVVLLIAGTGLLALTLTTLMLAHRTGDGLTPWIASYYASFWIPGGVISTATGVAMLRPLAALWRRTA